MRVAGATTQIAFQCLGDLRAVGLRIPLEQLHSGQDHAGRAVTTLQTVAFPKPFLHGMQFAVFGQPFDGCQFATIRLHGEDRARLDRLSVEQNGARAADARLATHVRAGEPAVVAQEMDQQRARLDFMLLFQSVDANGDGRFHRL